MIEHEDIERLDERYVKKDDCATLMGVTDNRVDDLKTDIAVMKTQLKILIGILSAIAVPVLAIAIKLLFGGT
jgi:hypothetical protein